VVRSTYVRGTCVYRDGAFTGARPGERLRRKGDGVSPGSAPRAPFTEHVDLASARLGGKALVASDDFFAPMDNLLKPEPPVFKPHEYTERGKWMDGWESRRKRVPGHDWCVIRLGTPGIVHGIVVDTAHFLGNYPPFCWLEATDATPDAHGGGVGWHEIVPRSPLRGGCENLFPVADGRRFTHVRLHIEPDGGVARLRVHGVVVPDWEALRASGALVDLASVLNGGSVVTCNDMFFGPKDNLILPGRGASMADGWETRRRREPGNDWIVLRLGRAGRVRRVEIDTAHFKGNFPDGASLEGCRCGAAGLAPEATRAGTDVAWRPILPRTPLAADHVHTFEIAPPSHVVDHVRLSIYPDGGVSRLRVWCEPDWETPGRDAPLR
jgi:allantoicase